MTDKPPFDPNKPFEPAPGTGEKPPFDPSKAFQAAPTAPVAPGRSTLADVAIESGKGLLRGAGEFAGTMGEAVMGPFGPSKHFEKLKASLTGAEPPKPEPTYGERIAKTAGIEAAPQTTAGKFAGTTAEVLGSPTTYAGPGSLALKTALGVTSALGSEAAGQFAEKADLGPGMQAGLRIAGGLAGGGGVGLATAERKLSKIAAELPGRAENKAAASQIYDALKQSNVGIAPAGMDELTRQIKTDLIREGARDFAGAHGAVTLRLADELITSGGSIAGIDAVRKALRRYKSDPAEGFFADRTVDHIDDFLMNVDPKYVVSGNPREDAQALKYAQSLWATNKQLEIIEEGSIRAQRGAGATGTGGNRINKARQEINRILNSDKKSRGLSQEAKDKMNEIVLGTWLTNRTRDASKYAPAGPVSAIPTILAGFAGGGEAAAAVAGTGFISKYLGEYLTQKQISELEALIKSESPLGAPIAQANAPAKAAAQALPAAAATRSVLTSPLATGGPYAGPHLGALQPEAERP